jgi:hypothetical protein
VDERTMIECMNILGLVDSIMEPGVTRTTLAFHNASGGDAKTAIELLADHYRGLAQMANMLVDWLVLTGVSGVPLRPIAARPLDASPPFGSRPLALAGEDRGSVHRHIEDYIQTLIAQYFAKDKADAILATEDVCAAPPSARLVAWI